MFEFDHDEKTQWKADEFHKMRDILRDVGSLTRALHTAQASSTRY